MKLSGELNEKDGFLLSRVDGVLTARKILDLAPLTAEEAQRSLLGLIYTGMVEYLREAPKNAQTSGAALASQVLEAWAALPHQSHYEVLGVASNARSAAILAACFRRALALRPRLPEAIAELAALHPGEGREGGMLKKLFQARRTGEAE